MLDNVFLQSGIPFDMNQSNARSYKLMEKVLDANLDSLHSSEAAPARKTKTSPSKESVVEEDEEESILSKAHKDIKS